MFVLRYVFPHVFDNVGFSCMECATAKITRLQYSTSALLGIETTGDMVPNISDNFYPGETDWK